MRNRSFRPVVSPLEPRELLSGLPDPTDPVLPPDGGKLHILIITPVFPQNPIDPPKPIIA